MHKTVDEIREETGKSVDSLFRRYSNVARLMKYEIKSAARLLFPVCRSADSCPSQPLKSFRGIEAVENFSIQIFIELEHRCILLLIIAVFVVTLVIIIQRF